MGLFQELKTRQTSFKSKQWVVFRLGAVKTLEKALTSLINLKSSGKLNINTFKTALNGQFSQAHHHLAQLTIDQIKTTN